jgi:hypothetical protein
MAERPLRILVPLPDRDFDTTESSVVWDALDTAGHEVVFATEHGAVAECDGHIRRCRKADRCRVPRSARPGASTQPETGKSLLAGRTVTTLIKPIEQYAFRKTFYRVGRRYRTYRTYTEDEVRAAVGPAGRVEHGSSWQEPLVVVDEMIVTARYPVDVEAYAERFVRLVENARLKPTA